MTPTLSDDVISPDQAATIPALFRERVARTPEATAYRFFDALNGVWSDVSWRQMARQVRLWQAAFQREDLQPGDRVAIMARNSHLWVMFDQAALALGLVVVPLFVNDRPENAHYILENCGAKLILLGEDTQWKRLRGRLQSLPALKCVLTAGEVENTTRKRVRALAAWLEEDEASDLPPPDVGPDDLATIVYTSGTTGAPKGVMLSHRNILRDAWGGLRAVPIHASDLFLSFLPLSHSLERTIGYYLPMMAGATVVHARSIPDLPQDLLDIRPTCLVSVPRIYERIHARIQEELAGRRVAGALFRLAVAAGWRRVEYAQGRAGWHPLLLVWPLLHRLVAAKVAARLGGRLRVALSGGAPLSAEIGRVFVGLGLPVLQGYGLTEASPVVSVNRLERNLPASIGPPVPGVEARIGEQEELLVRGDNVMLGYWDNQEATRQAIDPEGWLHTGDKARLVDGYLYITGRLKEIIVLANGEKIPPADMEAAITGDPLFEQAMVIGENRPFLTAIVVVDAQRWAREGLDQGDPATLEERLLERVAARLGAFPGYAEIKRLTWTREPWTVDNGMLTPILKLRRAKVCEIHAADIARMYEGHSLSDNATLRVVS